ncbi:MAG: bifunctional precorrin-2 dehydrogenase/sirohydrochlorin ferrochelatase [Candidatus Omnitrophota bacterium]
MELHPIHLKLENANCLVIGGGEIALRKVKELIKCCARIRVISPKLCVKLEGLKKKNKFKYIRTKYRKNLLKTSLVVFAATDEIKVNERIAKDAFARNLLVNVVDNPRLCNFYSPGIIRDKNFLLSISTQGKFPGMTKLIKNECQRVLKKYSTNFKFLVKLRSQIKQKYQDKKTREKIMRGLAASEMLAAINDKKIKSLKDLEMYLNIF